MAKLELSITNGVKMSFPHVIGAVERIEQTSRNLLVECMDVLNATRSIGSRLQTEVNDVTQSSLLKTTEDLETLSFELQDLQESAQALVAKLKRLEKMAQR